MSASREKKTRKVVVAPVTEQKKTVKTSTILAIVAVVLAVLLIAMIVVFKGPMLKKSTTALTVGEHKLTPVEVRYFYYDLFASLMNNGYSSYMSLLYPNGVEHLENESYFFSESTWGDYMLSQAETQIRATYAIYDEAMASGYTLSEADEADISNTELYINYYAQLSGLSNADSYLVNYYGSGSTLESYMAYTRVCQTVNSYSSAKEAGFEITADAISAEDAENGTAYNYYSYHLYSLTAAYETDADEAAIAAAMTEAKASADAIAAESADLDSYLAAVGAYAEDVDGYADGSKTLKTNVASSSIPEAVLSWLSDASRTEGDVEVIENESSHVYYIVYFVAVENNDYARVDAHMIQISSVLNDDGTVNAESTEAKATSLKQEYDSKIAGETEDELFSELAYENSESDTTVYTAIAKGTYGTAVDAWLFDSARAAGDTALINNDGTWYFVCYDGAEAQTYRSMMIESALRSAAFSDWYSAAIESVTLTENASGMKRVDMTLRYSASN